MDMIPDPYKIRLDKVSIKYLNAQNGVRMKSWRPSEFDAFLQSESSPSECVKFNIFPTLGQIVVVALRGTLRIHGIGPQSTSLVLHTHTFYACLVLFLSMHVFLKNDNKHTSWCSINSSNESNTIIIKNGFTFESKVSNVVVSKHVMSLSFSPSWLQVVLDMLQWHSKMVALCWNIECWPCCIATMSSAFLLWPDPVALGKN